MKKFAFTVSIILFFSVAAASADVKVRDANGNELGILLDHGDAIEYSPLLGSAKIFIPQLSRSIVISKMDGQVICGHFYWSDNLQSNPDYMADCGTIYGHEGGIYLCGVCPSVSDPITTTIYYEKEPYFSDYDGLRCGGVYYYASGRSRVAYQTEEIAAEDIPFLLPVALPLQYEYVPGPSGDTDNAALAEQVNMLWLEIMGLEERLLNHNHVYLTGEATGHNNKSDHTGPAAFSDKLLPTPEPLKNMRQKDPK